MNLLFQKQTKIPIDIVSIPLYERGFGEFCIGIHHHPPFTLNKLIIFLLKYGWFLKLFIPKPKFQSNENNGQQYHNSHCATNRRVSTCSLTILGWCMEPHLNWYPQFTPHCLALPIPLIRSNKWTLSGNKGMHEMETELYIFVIPLFSTLHTTDVAANKENQCFSKEKRL